ncbi:MAG: hypothetical protein MRZ61_09275 [Oscillospiraceae bacterium]|nr:hypothetical protein [Oscillospiraceae bacterium]
MKMTLNRLKIENFKGIRAFEIIPNGKNLEITGRNKLGKTTIYDSFLWLLFGKNSAGETKFTIKPTNLPVETENSVEADFTVDGKPLTLKKVYASKYVKTTGEYKSSELECYINGVPKKVREYEGEIAKIIGEEQFKLLTNPKHFTENLDWKKRREILFALAGNKTDSEIAAENTAFSKIETDLENCGNSTDLLKVITAQVKANSERINTLPMRINENINNLSGRSENPADVEKEISVLRNKAAEISEKIGGLKVWNPKESPEYKEVSESLADLIRRNQEFRAEQEIKEREAKRDSATKLTSLRCRLSPMQTELRIIKDNIRKLDDERRAIIADNNRLNALEWSGDTVCPTCGQAIPQDRIDKAKADFKAELTAKFDYNIKRMSEIKKALDGNIDKNNRLAKSIAETEKEISALETSTPVSVGVFDIPEYEEHSFEIKARLAELGTKPNPHMDEIYDLNHQLEEISKQIDDKTTILNALKLDERTNSRIAELKAEQQKLRGEQAKLQMKLDLVNSFIRYKVDRITETVNGMFKIAKFKLFELNKTNDGLTECCDAVAFGADRYGDINTAGKILVGIDIISTLSERYGLSVPLFIDNIDGLDSSSYTELLNSVSDKMQLITLRVSDNDKLTVQNF